MKKAPPVRLSLRKLFIAMLAVGPIAILPSPIMAAVPTTTPFTPTSGTATWDDTSVNVGVINASNRAVLTWGTTAQGDSTTITNFNIQSGDTFNFVIDGGGAVLNRVVGGNNATNAAAIINGELNSNGQVFVLANGNISVGAGAEINATGGLVLSTLDENNFEFTSNGRLALSGTSLGSITVGTGASVVDVTGNLAVHSGTIALNNLTVSGDLIVGNSTTLSLTGAGAPTTVGGNLTVTTNNTAIAQGTGQLIVDNGHTTLSSGTGAITLATATNDFKSLTINTSGNGGDVEINDADVVTLAASTIGGDLDLTAAGTTNSNAISTNGTLTIGGNAIFAATASNSAINIGNSSTVAGALSITTNNAAVTFNGTGNLVTDAITSGTGAAIAITTNGTLKVEDTITATNGNITLTGTSITQNAAVGAGTGVVTLNATNGNITTAAITGNAVTLNASQGSINPSGQSGIITTTNAGGTSSVRASGTINLTNTNAFAAGQVIQVPAGSNVAITNGASIVLGTSNVTGNLTLNATAGDIVLGTGSGSAGQNITVGGNLVATVAGTSNITDNNFSAFNVAGGLNLTTGTGNVVLDAASANGGLAPNVQFGQVKISSGGNVTVSERTTLNLGDVTADNLNATSVGGGIINSGNLTVPGTANFTTSGASTSVITNGTNSIGVVNFIGSGGALTVGSGGVTLGADTNVTAGDDVVLTSTNGGAIILEGATIGGSLTINSAGTIATADTTTTTVGGDLSLTAGDSGASSIDDGANGRLSVTGVTTIAASGNVTLNQGHEFTGGVVLNQGGNTGDVTIWDVTDLTVSGTAGGAVNVAAGSTAGSNTDNLLANPWALVLGNLSAGSLTAAATNGGAGNSGTLSQAAGTGLHIEGTLTGVTNGANIVLANDGNSAGRIQFFTNGATGNGTGTISYREDGTIRVGNLASNSNITLRSNFGSIIEDTAMAVVINARATLNATASNGSINLGGTTNSGTTTANVATFIASAPMGSVAVTSNDSISLGAINANSLTVSALNNITQNATTPLSVFGTASFTSTNTTATRNITLTNNANNFGPVTLQLGNSTGRIAITEAATLNLRKVTMVGGGNGTFTATSVNGDIIDSGFAGVKLGGNATATGSGVVTLTATNGNITLINPSSDIATTAGVVFNAKDVTFSVLGNSSTSLVLGAASTPSQATGNLSVTNLLGSIDNAGPMTVGGMAFFQTPSGNINVSQNGVGFGTLKFIGQQVQIAESGNMDIATGSTASGPAALLSGGSITIVNVGGGNVTFANTVNLTAAGNITPGNLLQAGGVLRVSHTGTADLGQLSIGGNLNGITPVDAGTGTYVPPTP